MIKAPITPGIQPQIVRIKIIIKDPQPLSIMESGGKIIANKTLNKFICKSPFYFKDDFIFILLQYTKELIVCFSNSDLQRINSFCQLVKSN